MEMIIEEKPKIKPIPVWKWILLHFCPMYTSFDSEGDIVCVCYAKILFKHMYFMEIGYYSMTTGNLLKTEKLTRRG